MNVDKIAATNAATVQALQDLRARGASIDPLLYPYYGYYTVDLFESPSFVMFTNHDCPRGHDIFHLRRFEPQSMKVWCRLARTATGILDIGAHVGVYSLAAAALRPDIKIHAFEPNPNAYTRLRMHKLVNGFDNIVEHWYAVGNQDGHVEFAWVKKSNLQISSGGGVGRRTGNNIEQIVVPQHKLNGTGIAQAIGTRPLIKIDVEGGEVATVKGISEIFDLNADFILETFHQQSCDAINSLLQSLGYNVFKIFEKRGTVEPVDMLRPCDVTSGDFNHLLTRCTAGEVAALLA